jgi:diguanylate cyclase (GGDEF)-like protein
MRRLTKKYGLLLWLSLLLITGFISIILTGYYVAKNSLIQDISKNGLPITGDTIYSEIQKDFLRPISVSAQMAQDTFARDWILEGENDSTLIAKYLKEIKSKNNAISSFLVSNQSLNYYYPEGVLKTLSKQEARDQWFFRIAQLKADYETNVDFDLANQDKLTVFTNHRVLDYQGNFIGVTGIGISLDTIKAMITSYQQRFDRSIYFADKLGNIVLTANTPTIHGKKLQSIEGLSSLSTKILENKSNDSLHLEYQNSQGSYLLNARYIPELGWHLLVEHELNNSLLPLQKVLFINLAVGICISLLIIGLVLTSVRRFQTKLEKSAATDSLTTLLNRQAFDFVFQQAMLDSERSRMPLCVIIFDIDHFKKINDSKGHLIGDHVLKELAMIAKRSLRESDVICRWGGEEFLILLKNCQLEKATSIAETLRETIANNDFARTTTMLKKELKITVSMGVAECKLHETSDSVFERADIALYQAKENGRNSVYFSE